ncbi:bifunctional 3-(3-hydroxy-phenyl)propionate/3-hydroxycinnamic acid hydroxylase [Sphingobium sp. SJ10-10]|uniref:bifunctional 3-(3-hydroxy-phenyl)propionate/3-hydroxycinnamic acid hydroxylase n=1 Tax=Sphingobium sp. SJ10-10 TaxID=3114999 RepID=UPI002E175E2E|nr:bifunctional 3-(3-hydroxy-phenyl)propionate/3-hydroxycinnamic acid hydroxylase [Sphingobium sp. SJ10-10]
MLSTFDVAVIGYGASGAVLADLLLSSGLSVVIFDRWPNVLEIPRAAHIDDETMRTFQMLSIPEAMPDSVIPTADYAIYDALDRRIGGYPGLESEPTDQGWLSDYYFVQPAIEHYLRKRATENGAMQKLGCQVVDLEEHQDKVLVSYIRSGASEKSATEQVLARYVVGCDGSNSFVCKHLDIGVDQLADSQRWMIVDIRVNEGVPVDINREAWTKVTQKETLTYVPMPQHMHRFEFALTEDMKEEDVKTPAAVADFVSKWFAPGDYEVLRAHVYHFHSRVAQRWRVGRVFLAGDSAHTMPPFLGQGVCSAIRDSLNLGWKLARVLKGSAPEALLESYESERHPNAYNYVKMAGAVGDRLRWMATATAEELATLERQDFGDAQVVHVRLGLGAGMHEPAARGGGRLSPQPFLADGRRLDDAVGYNFALVGDPALISQLSSEVRSSLEAIGAVLVPDGSQAVVSAISAIGGSVMLIRPDRYLVGVAESVEGIEEMVRGLATRLLVNEVSDLS